MVLHQICCCIIGLLAIALLCNASPLSRNAQPRVCGFASCNPTKPGMLNVHLVPHTHDDVGWLKTVDQYFYGSRNNIQVAGVQYIIDSVIMELSKDPSRKFIYVETSFFWQWWLEQDDVMRTKVQALVNAGQLEFISGAWSMNDEAAAHYQSIVDQFTWGLKKLNDTFGECGRPRVGWQIDPFGHAREMASLSAHFGFDGLFFARLDYQDKNNREQTRTTELLWQASANLGDASTLFTSILYYFYMAPSNFCFDIECNDEPIIDNVMSPDYNVDVRISEFIDRINEQNQYYRSGNIIMTMGGDFNYQQADTWYKNIDKLIKYINEKQVTENSTINLLYSTPSCYLQAVNEANLTWTTKQDDFFPYSSDPHAFWTGYFTSRPTQKYYERKGNNFLQVCKQVHALAGEVEDAWTDVASLREIMGVMQHHDAITGTEKQHVADDYALRLSQGFDDCQATVENGVNKLMAVSVNSPKIPMSSCMLSNISQCEVSETNSTFVVTVYNPTAQLASQFVRLPVLTGFTFNVIGPSGAVVSQLVPIPALVQSIPGRVSNATFELVFRASDLPPLGFKTYHITRSAADIASPLPVSGDNKYTIGNERLQATLDPATGLLSSLRVNERNVNVTQAFHYYDGAVGNNEVFENRSSGAYIFRPLNNMPTPILDVPTIETFTGPIVDEVHQKFNDWISQVIRTYHGEEYLELEWLVGPIPVNGDIGKEVIIRFSETGWQTNGIFYTDSNGREMLQRQRNFRPTWTVDLQEPVAGNYYPITTAIAMDNSADDSRLIVLNDRAQGGSSINDGEIEIMVHRRLMHDDAFGVNEPLDEQAFGSPLVVRGRHLVILGSRTTSPTVTGLQRKLTLQKMVSAPWVLLTPTSLTPQEWQASYKTQWSGLRAPLPDNVHLLTLEPWRQDEILLRLEHLYETTDDTILSQPASVVLEEIFSELLVHTPHETTLGANQWLEDSSRLEWTATGVGTQQLPRRENKRQTRLTVDLNPMEMRTFVMKTGALE